MPKDWKKVFQEELCQHGVELDFDGGKVKGLVPACIQPKCLGGESADLVVYIDADAEVSVRSTLSDPKRGKLTVVSNDPEPSQKPPMYRILMLEKESKQVSS